MNVTATVTDDRGRFVDGLSRHDFRIYEDGSPQEISHFSAERVPVSLGIVLDTSGSMAGEKMRSAQRALDRFLFDLLDPVDEVFLYRFSNYPILVRGWTTDRRDVSGALRRVDPVGGTAMYDTVAEAVPLANRGAHRKKALVIISDGNDTNSVTDPHSLRQLVRETEVLVYAIGIDGGNRTAATLRVPPRAPLPMPFPVPGGDGRSPRYPRQRAPSRQGDRSVNEAALRELTDDSGGRTEIIRSADDLDPATAGVANELSRQYYMAYPAQSHRDGRWHSIEVEVPGAGYRVRARRGYVATR
ncbi:MAG: VWA domain-containing protein [Vicinamibacterales bacterium]|nr:VWA domain-containing protein [Vicinamibacterales bacterium]